ncbi:multivesicular body subunit 12A-like isoform X1 [Acipenser ruthenus]|uniref:multivesicular body subunit 12A-like isoform X1 n=1 Tax=Acipenser ruthenus TaxID=7906 RepID=UPI002741EA3A|nr:multivesicular body subunit 12A-like isoform X1 [Acipenser ruthenus]XP_058863073.1 multivesicular body subunit 12A-like isoform X1 [Acipenser ruthenus]
MSVEAASVPLTALAWASGSSTCPNDFKLISTTFDGSNANFGKGFGMKSSYYLCCSSKPQGSVITDIQFVSEKESLPSGFYYIAEFLEPRASVSKKKRLCVKSVSFNTADVAVLDVQLTAKSKVILPHYTCIGDMNGFVLWCKKGRVRPLPKPRSINLDMRELSLEKGEAEPQSPAHNSSAASRPVHPNKLSKRRSTLEIKEAVYDTGNIYSISAMDGVPFALHPKFDCQPNGNVPLVNLNNIQIKSITDIENEYNYSFTVEKTAADRPQFRSALQSLEA